MHNTILNEKTINFEKIKDPIQMKMIFHFFPKSGVLRKTSPANFLSGKYELRTSRILVVYIYIYMQILNFPHKKISEILPLHSGIK